LSEALAASAGATVEDLTTITWAAGEVGGERYALVFGWQVAGADHEMLFETLLRTLLADTQAYDLEPVERGGKSATLVRREESDWALFPGADEYVYGADDFVVMALATENMVDVVLDLLPDPA
jgi:hypothetical protein